MPRRDDHLVILLAIAFAVGGLLVLRRAPPVRRVDGLAVALCSAWVGDAVTRYVTLWSFRDDRAMEVFCSAASLLVGVIVAASRVPIQPAPALPRAWVRRRRARYFRVIVLSKASSPCE